MSHDDPGFDPGLDAGHDPGHDPSGEPVGGPGDESSDLDTDPALAAAVLEIEAHAAEEGWDRPGRLFALVDTARLVEREPAVAEAAGLTDASAAGSMTPVEQDQLPAERPLEEMLAEIAWPPEVTGCAVVVERLVLPPGADHQIPDDAAEADAFARTHPDRQEVRIVAGATRAGATYCALRLRAHDDEQSVVTGPDLVPGLLELVSSTLHDGADDGSPDGTEHDDGSADPSATHERHTP